MASGTVEQRIHDVVEKLTHSDEKTIVLFGEHGIGKTWTAREVLEKARKLRDPGSNDLLFGFTLWVSMNREFDKWTFYEKIAYQLSLPSSDDDQEKKEDDNDDEQRAAEKKEWRLENLKKKISAKLAKKRYFVILDDEGNTMNEAEIMSELETNVLSQASGKKSKVLITRITGDEGQISGGDKIFIEVKPLPEQELLKLLRERAITENYSDSRYDSYFKTIIKMSNGLPAAIITVAVFLRYISEHDDGVWKFESTLEEVAKLNDYQKMTQLLSSALYTSPRTEADIDTDMIDCSWQSRQFFSGVHCSVHYNELITYWILEGCLGDVDDVDKAYARGHSVLMKLVKSGMLTKQEDNYVSMDEFLLEVVDRRRYVYRGTASVGLTNVFKDLKWEGLGIISKSLSNGEKPLKKLSTLLIDWHRLCREVPDSLFDQLLGLRILALFNPRLESMPSSLSKLRNLDVLVLRGCFLLKTIDNIEKLNALTVLEISCADESLEEIPNKLFEHMPKLRTFILSGKRIKSLPESISNQIELCRLILSGCSDLVTLPIIAKLTKLEILDLSGAKSFKRFTDKSFESLAELQLLDLSHTQIESLPFLKKLGKLSRLFLRGSPLYRLRFLDALKGLEILDLSDSKSCKDFKDNVFQNKESLRIIDLSGTKMECFRSTSEINELELIDLSNNANMKWFEDKTLEHLTSLRLLNISKTSVRKLPGLSNLYSLRQLLLNGCSVLEELSEMDGLTGLEVLDLSCAKALKKIEHLNHYANLRRLLLHGCSKLQKLPQLGDSLKLKELDLSGCEALTDIQDTSFEHLTRLEKLNLSTTKIESLPSLSNLTSLLHLSLRECINLKELPPLESLSNLKELDLFGASKLGEIRGDQFLQHMESLRILNLSGIPRVTLPSMSKLPKLKQLVLQGCSELDNISGLETLTELEILNLSETKISSLPPLNSFSKLRELLLRGLLIKELNGLNSLGQLEALDLFRTGIEEFPYEISNLTHLRHLDLPKMDGYQVDWGRIKWLPKELNLEECGLFKVPEPCIENNNCKLSITVTSTKLFEFFKSIPELWETYFKQFEISVCSLEHCEDSDILSAKDEEMFREIYALHTRKSTDPDKSCRSLEIRGFDDSFPTGLEVVLTYAESVSFSDNKFKNCLSILRAKSMKRCWIERCNEMENVVSGKEEDGGRLGAGLEFLWVSNMAKLKCVYSNESMQPESFNNLKELYLDCCPKLVHVFSSSHRPTKLEILQIKFCDQLETIFEENAATAFEMPNLRTLHLVNLPKLTSIGGVLLPPQFKMKQPIECPHLKYSPELHCEVSNPDVC